MIIGEVIDDPYEIANIRTAFSNLTPNQRGVLSEQDVQPTHLYVKFKPQTWEEYYELSNDKSLTLFPYPLDRKIIQYGTWYRDAEYSPSGVQYQYAAIEVGKANSLTVAFDILKELYIPELVPQTRATNSDVMKALLKEAYRLKGKEVDFVETRAGIGEIEIQSSAKVWDETLGEYIPLEGLELVFLSGYISYKGIVDENGFTVVKSTFTNLNPNIIPSPIYDFYGWMIKWEARKFSITHINDANKKEINFFTIKNGNGPAVLYIDIRIGGPEDRMLLSKETFRATMFRAAYHYYEKPNIGTSRPLIQSNGKLEIWSRTAGVDGKVGEEILGNNKEICKFYFEPGVGSEFVYINNKNVNDYSIVYANTIHELSHSAYYAKNKALFRDISIGNRGNFEAISESLAVAVEQTLTNQTQYSHYSNYLRAADDFSSTYSGIVVDMIGAANPSFRDLVSTRYTLTQVERSLTKTVNGSVIYITNLTEWKNNFKTLYCYDNKSRAEIDAVFAYWAAYGGK